MKAKLAFIAAHAAEHAIRLMCRVLSVSPSWFHAWRAAAPKRAARQAARDVLADKIRDIFEDSRRRYGTPRIHAELLAQDLRISRKTVAKIIHHSRGWCALKAWAVRLAKRRGLGKAKVALARKLAVVLHRMWLSGQPYRIAAT